MKTATRRRPARFRRLTRRPAPTAAIRIPLAEELRVAFEGLIVQHINGQADDGWVALHLADRRRDLPSWDRWALWEDLTDAYQRWQDAQNGEVCWDHVEPEYRDPDLYEEKMRAELDERLDDLVSGAAR